jgi:hypothetical protein
LLNVFIIDYGYFLEYHQNNFAAALIPSLFFQQS